uniref:Uncharacterized protein n=1 Tax=Glossina palpalis gambiensis TaxID=67801 RepID=A0A1B0C3H0_9MUSC
MKNGNLLIGFSIVPCEARFSKILNVSPISRKISTSESRSPIPVNLEPKRYTRNGSLGNNGFTRLNN